MSTVQANKGFLVSLATTLTLIILAPEIAFPQEVILMPGVTYSPKQDDAHDRDLRFLQPLIAESPSPDTKIRFDYFFRTIENAGLETRTNTVQLEGEYAFHRAFSIEVDVPFLSREVGSSSESNLANVEARFKFANFAFEEYGILLGYGMNFELPTGNDTKGIGNDHLFRIEPFFSFGYKERNLEVVASTAFGIPTNQLQPWDPVKTDLEYNLSPIYHLTPELSGLLEIDGTTIIAGPGEGNTMLNITPGVILSPQNSNLRLGAGVSFPMSERKQFDVQAVLSLFSHF